MLEAQLKAFSAAELASSRRTSAGRTTVRVSHADMRAFAVQTINIFTEQSWNTHLASPQARMDAPPEGRGRSQRRAGPTAEQEAIWGAIRQKAQSSWLSLYDLSTKKRPARAQRGALG